MELQIPENVVQVQEGLETHGYFASAGLASALFLSLSLQRPLFLEGEPGVGKTEVAKVLSNWLQTDLIRLQCYEGLDAAQAMYEWDYSRQLLHLRISEASGRATETDEKILEDELYDQRFLVKRPLLQAIDYQKNLPPVLLIDEIDRADDEFEAFLLEILSDYSITIPEIGSFTATVPPIVVVTSNRTRDVHDALKRRCLYHWVEHPGYDREVEILKSKAPTVAPLLLKQIASVVGQMREMNLYKPPGVSESIDWALALDRLGSRDLDEESILSTIGALLKYREDQEKLKNEDLDQVLQIAYSRAG
ncbi:MAG TPA: MoxR family ATPase [Acidimicrobiales bacterium]|jgi:MoxR-like ATPase|nr:MoxR family ATPase [Acidimicrobiales bacterium]